MKKVQIGFIALIMIMSVACNTDADNNKNTMDSIGNPTPNPTHTDTLRSISDTLGRTDTLNR